MKRDTGMYRLSKNVTFRPPSELTGNMWLIELLNCGKVWKTNALVIEILMNFRIDTTRGNLIDKFEKKIDNAAATINHIIDKFQAGKVIIQTDSDDTHTVHPSLDLMFWSKFNAIESGRYHRATFDFPFMDYSPNGEGWEIAREHMRNYASQKPDEDRMKTSYEYLETEKLQPIEEIINSIQYHHSFEEQIKAISSVCFLKIGEKPVPWSKSPLIRRTSPSGGSRHPSEGYLLTRSNSIYHLSTQNESLGKIAKHIDLNRLFGNLDLLAGIDDYAIFFITSVFERNSYRYREPRTFRTIHMDAGHIAGTAELVAQSFDLGFKDIISIDETYFNECVGIDGFEEFLIGCFAIVKKN